MPSVERILADAVGHSLPAPIVDPGLEARVQAEVPRAMQTVVALDDDPTGVQTVHDIPVLTDWEPGTLRRELARAEPLFFVLTNSRSLVEGDATDLNLLLGQRLQQAAEDGDRRFVVVSRSDSTLRGHFPAETDALAGALGSVDGVLICPAFFEGGRVTVDDVHFLIDGDVAIPAADTEFARDATFGYAARTLPEWVEEKSGGRILAQDVASIALDDVRIGGADRVAELLLDVRDGQPVVLNAVNYADLWTIVLGILQAESRGKRFLYRTGASFVRARAGIGSRPLLTRADLLETHHPGQPRGIVVVGSHVKRSSEQLDRLLTHPRVIGIEIQVPALLANGPDRDAEIARVGALVHEVLVNARTPVVYTSREIVRPDGLSDLAVAQSVSAALVEVIRRLDIRPDFIIGKGGITSSDIGAHGLRAGRPMVMGQIRPGVPVWQLDAESAFPGLPYVVFPGNVGGPDTLLDIVSELVGP